MALTNIDRAWDHRAHQMNRLFHHGLWLNNHFFNRLGTGVGHHLVDQLARTARSNGDFIEIATELLILQFVCYFSSQSVIANNRAENIVEIMGNTAGEITKRIHLLRMVELLLNFILGVCLKLRFNGDIDDLVYGGEKNFGYLFG